MGVLCERNVVQITFLFYSIVLHNNLFLQLAFPTTVQSYKKTYQCKNNLYVFVLSIHVLFFRPKCWMWWNENIKYLFHSCNSVSKIYFKILIFLKLFFFDISNRGFLYENVLYEKLCKIYVPYILCNMY